MIKVSIARTGAGWVAAAMYPTDSIQGTSIPCKEPTVAASLAIQNLEDERAKADAKARAMHNAARQARLPIGERSAA